MKLVKIKDVRVGHIIKQDNEIFIIDEDHGQLCRLDANDKRWRGLLHWVDSQKGYDCEIIGKLGITHKIEDNKLVEIPRDEEVKAGDILKKENSTILVLDESEDVFFDGDRQPYFHTFEAERSIYMLLTDVNIDEYEHYGIYGVTHEFVNDCEVKND